MYVAHNMRQVDAAAAPNFGNLVIVMRHATMGGAVLINPIDSGAYELFCNASSLTIDTLDNNGNKVKVTVGGDKHVNCSAWPANTSKTAVVGTFEHMNHLIL